MHVRFRDTALRRRFEDIRKGTQAWNAKIARKYIQRVSILFAAASIDDLRRMAVLRFHALGADRAGQFAIDLEKKRWRLIVSFENDGNTVSVDEVSNHYDD